MLSVREEARGSMESVILKYCSLAMLRIAFKSLCGPEEDFLFCPGNTELPSDTLVDKFSLVHRKKRYVEFTQFLFHQVVAQTKKHKNPITFFHFCGVVVDDLILCNHLMKCLFRVITYGT